ncbi:hypothetical protein ACFY7H_13170 [Streptomyces sp. NPDC012794]|uniref:hypothetical protein n=1 Tax=Streptomyces sp. NPDC012794 TaxID=3364850 RepID=UPI0036CD3DC1
MTEPIDWGGDADTGYCPRGGRGGVAPTAGDDLCDACGLYMAALRGLLADWHAAGQPQQPSAHSQQIGAALAMYLQHEASRQNA